MCLVLPFSIQTYKGQAVSLQTTFSFNSLYLFQRILLERYGVGMNNPKAKKQFLPERQVKLTIKNLHSLAPFIYLSKVQASNNFAALINIHSTKKIRIWQNNRFQA